jgi:hypothetical protein
MALHHIRNVQPLLAQFFAALTPGGAVCIADLDAEGGEFHEDCSGVFHNGFDREALANLFAEAGFTDVQGSTAAQVTKPSRSGGLRTFSIMLMCGRKPSRQ